MQARRITTSSPHLPSSPPSALLQEGEAYSPTEARGVPSPAQTLWTAPSPTQTLGHSSPELPPLPSLALGGLPRTPSTVARHQATDSTYYTASWGSPYQRPPPGFSLGSALRDPLALGSDDLEEDSSSLQFGLEHLLPSRLTEDGSPNQFSLDHLLPSRLPANQAQTPTKSTFTPKAIVPEATPRPIGFGFSDPPPEELLNGPTGNWVRQFLAGNWDNEKANWWSDESTDNESGVKKQVQEQQPSSEPQAKEKKGHKSRKENLTLKQQDFWAHFSRDQKESFGKMMSSKYADPSLIRKVSAPSQEPQLPSPVSAEKPLPPPPTEEITQTSPKVTSGPIPQSPMNEHATRLPSAPRPRKKVPWKGKSCWVFIPTDVARGTPGYPPKPLSSPEVLARMQHFEQAGYDTRGFGREEEDVTGSNGLAQNRAVFPDTADYVEDRNSGPFRVRIPNKTEWEAYVNYLTEQKLAALGVSIGGEEEETPMSRNPSSQYPGLPFSPPPPTSSGGSQRHGHHGSVISSAFPHGPSPGHASTRSIASPISPFGNPRGSMHMHRHSTFTSPSNFTPQQPTPPGIPGWSPQQYFGPQGARGGSPALQHSRPDLGDVVSPGSPYGFRQNQQYPFPQKEDLLVQMQQQQQQQLQSQLLHQQQQQLLSIRPSSTLAEVPEDEAEEDEVPKIKQDGQPGPHIAVPTPRGHRHNISENLEKEIQIQDAEYHLEQAIDKQLEEGGEFSTEPRFGERDPLKEHINLPNPHASGSSWEEARPVQQVLHQPQPHSRAHSLAKPQRPVSFNSQITDNQHGEMSDGAKTNISEITNPSLEDGCKRAGTNGSNQHSKTTSQASNAWKDSKPPFDQPGPVHNKHTSKSSISKLNVEAKEFKFSPAASFNPGNFQFSGFALSPVSSKPLSKEDPAAPRTNKPSLDGLGSGLNVTAPAFKPGGMNGSAFPTSNFDFLSKAPSFKPDAPAFKPSLVSPGFAPSPLIPVPSSVPSRIFGNINFNANDIIKPARRSKAVPIVRPDNTQQQAKGNEDKEDESGRITQADGREKRARHGRDDGNEVPQFALPSHPLSETTQFQAAKQDPQIEREPVAENKENLSPEAEQNQAKPKTPELSPTVALQREESSFGPVVRTPKTDEMSATMSDSNIISGDHDKRETESVTPTVEEEPKPFTKKHASKGSLSATAKPFEYRPQFGSGFDFGLHVTKPSVARSEDYDNIHTSPQRHVSRSPATTFRPSDDGSYQTAPEPRKHAPWPENESVDFDYAHPSFNEIDAVMKHLNEEGSDFGVEKDDTPWDQSSPRRSLHDFDHKDLQPSKNLRSDAPSPSPRRLYAPASGTLGASSASITHDPFSDERAGLAYESPVHRLNNADEIPVSDWDEGISSEGEDKIQTRSRFFDSHVNALIGRLLQDRLGPLEKSLQFIQDAVGQMTQRGGRSRRSMSNDRLDSDADDEDDEVGAEFHYRNRSPRKDRKLEKIRAIVMEALASHQPQNAASEPAPATALEPVQPHLDMSEFYQALGDVKASIARSASSSVQPEDFREMIEEALKRQSAEINQRRENQAADENEARIADLESMFREATLRVDAEVEARKAIESREASTQHLLKVTEEELTLLRESSQDDENKLRALNHECQDARIKIDAYHIAEEELRTKLFALAEENDDLKRTAVAYESSEEDLRKKLSAVTAENEALQFTLEEYRLSSNKWRDEIQQSNEENAGLKKAIESLKSQSEESTRIREAMRGKLEKLQQDMVIAMGQVAAERAQWQKSDEEHMKKYEVLSARIEAEGRTRERLERELERLEIQEREGMKLKVALEQTQQANSRLEESVNSLRLESSEHQKAAEKFERDFHEAREAGRVELQRTRTLMEADIDVANNQVNIVRANLESEIARLRAETDNVRMDADTAKARHELQLEEAADSKRQALDEAMALRNAALQEQQDAFERRIELLQQEHARALQISVEDRQRSEEHLKERLSLADATLEHLRDKVDLLEEKLSVAKSAAHAAVQAAQSAKAPVPATSHHSNHTGMPEKISPQALRESIAVLQEQLQERESRIEGLEEKLSKVDTEAPAKLKERDTEIGWLRELLGVRVDDITDLINALSQPTFDRDGVRDAAIRIRTNLQMEQHEKERLMTSGQAFPTLASLSNFASPKAVQLAAAFGNWRRGRDTATSSLSGASSSTSRTQTPSRVAPFRTAPAPSAQSFLSGLMTPPTSNLRRTPQAPSSIRPQNSRSNSSTSTFRDSEAGFPGLGKQTIAGAEQHAPSTPPLLGKASYDQDAEDGRYSENGFYDDEDSTVDGNPGEVRGFDGFGPGLLR
ncbi:hypothetical protein K432DRAFT_341117 [Lepidopterella palustris CBS 459.81]|uniref:Myosin class II heavy chain n=1 Tax=Lepidopterella palustris CBS 459.81 TaxID=1314670 RepID=A0A8E2JKT9_9PEZI|nr:hypothetical protein K432DRAFT_341117 [Lepidopterella palustris CBS 459.81]